MGLLTLCVESHHLKSLELRWASLPLVLTLLSAYLAQWAKFRPSGASPSARQGGCLSSFISLRISSSGAAKVTAPCFAQEGPDAATRMRRLPSNLNRDCRF